MEEEVEIIDAKSLKGPWYIRSGYRPAAAEEIAAASEELRAIAERAA